MAVAKDNISREEVGSTIISPFQEVMLLMLAWEGGRRWEGVFGSTAVAADCAACPANTSSCSWGKCMLP